MARCLHSWHGLGSAALRRPRAFTRVLVVGAGLVAALPRLGVSAPPAATAQPPAELASASLSFAAAQDYHADGNPQSLATGDLRRIGRSDVVTANSGSADLTVFLGRGDGSFASTNYSAGGTAVAVAIADANGDGIPDIMTGNGGSNSVSVLLGRGDGTFGSAIVTSVPSGNPVGLAAGDLNGDGKPDVVVNAGNGVGTMLGNGDGTFGAERTFAGALNRGPGSVALSDFNGDGRLDVVAGSGLDSQADPIGVDVFLGNGDGTLQTFTFYPTGNTYQNAHQVLAGDFNRDGSADIAVLDSGCSGLARDGIYILLGAGNGTFGTATYVNGSNAAGCVNGEGIGDVNGDGTLDLIALYNNQPGSMSPFTGNGDGSFSAAGTYSLSPGWSPQAAVTAVLNASGLPDVVTANAGTADISVMLNTSPVAPEGGVPSSAEHSAGASGTAPYLQGSCGCHGQPIDTAYGNFWHTFEDLSIPGRGIPLDLTRTYSSVNAAVNGPLGYGWTFGYAMSLAQDPVTGAVTIHEENGGQVVFTQAGRQFSAPPRDIATLLKNQDGSFTFTRQARVAYTFNPSGQLTAETDLNAYSTTFGYNGSGQLSAVTDPAARSLTFSWTGANLTTVTDPIGRSVTYAYNDGQGNLTDVTDVNGGLTHFTYDGNHRLLTMTDPLGQVTTTVYDPSTQRVTSQTETVVASDRSKDRTTSFGYTGDNSSQAGGTVTITDPKGNVTVEHYVYGERVSVTKGYGTSQAATWTYTYDPATLGMIGISDPNGHTMLMSYDARGNLLTSTDPLNRSTVTAYDGLNDPTSTTDPKGVVTALTYDGAGNLQSRSTPLVGSSPQQSETTVYHYGDPGHPGDVTSITDPDSKLWQTSYDQYGDVASQTDPVGDLATDQYNTVGWKTSSVSPRGNVAGCGCATQYTTTFDYTDLRTGQRNGFGDVGTVTDPLGHTTQRTYDSNRNLISLKDGDGKVTGYSYDLADEQTQVTRADQTTLKTDYNPDGTVLDQVDGLGRTTTYGYDPLARVTSVADPLNRTTSQTYDGAGNKLTVTDPQSPPQTATYTYDAANELSGIRYSDGRTPTVSNLTYDADGQRTGMTDGTGTSSSTWDSLHRLVSETNGANQAVGYGYDLKGQLTSITYPGNHTVSRVYDDAGRLHTVTDWLSHTTTYTDDPDSNVTGQAYPNGTTAAFTVDAAQRLMSISDAPTSNPNSPFASFSYGRDGNNQVTSVTSAGVPADNNTYGYTPLNQLSSVNSSSYGYDAADNATALPNGTIQSYDAANQISQAQLAISLAGTSSAETASGTGVVMQLPNGLKPNDQLIAAVTIPGNVSVTGVSTGYSLVASAATGTHNGDTQTLVYHYLVTGSDPLPQFTFSKSTAATAVLAVYRGVNPTTPFDVTSSGTTASGTQVTAPSVTASLSGERLLMIEGATGRRVASWTQPSGMTDEVHLSDQAASAAALGDQALSAAGATGTRTATFGTSTALVGVAVALKPAVNTYTFDPRGDRTTSITPSGTSTTLAYDQANRLTGYGGATYTYNGDGLRMSKNASGFFSFAWDVVEGQPLLMYDGSTSYVYGPGGTPLEQITPSGTVLYFHQDQIGSTRLLTDQTGTVQAAYTYDAYGNVTGKTGTASTPLQFAGQYTDAESGLQYLRARDYDPSTAQFISRDPLVATTRLPYSYVGGNPLNAADASGLDPRWFELMTMAYSNFGESDMEFEAHGMQRFGERRLIPEWADQVVNNAQATYETANGLEAHVWQYGSSSYGVVVTNAQGKVANGYRGIKLRDLCRFAQKFGYKGYSKAFWEQLQASTDAEVTEQIAEAEQAVESDVAPAEAAAEGTLGGEEAMGGVQIGYLHMTEGDN